MYAFQGKFVSQQQLLEEASHIEVDILEGASGYHDPSICALGGLKLIEYHGSKIQARAIQASPETRQRFEDSLLFFYGGRHHKSKPSLDLLSSQLSKALPTLHAIKGIAFELEKAFEAGDLQQIAEIIGEMQTLKQQLPGKFVDDYVLDVTKRVRDVGAYAQLPGGKISAFVIVCCPNGQQEAVRKVLSDLRETNLKLEHEGTKAISL
jgi:D-glycero-alpha-D-manno-heptose-7-phosphate kinase